MSFTWYFIKTILKTTMPKATEIASASLILANIDIVLKYTEDNNKRAVYQLFFDYGELVDDSIVENSEKYQEYFDYKEESRKRVRDEAASTS
jgi:hypothetical protein